MEKRDAYTALKEKVLDKILEGKLVSHLHGTGIFLKLRISWCNSTHSSQSCKVAMKSIGQHGLFVQKAERPFLFLKSSRSKYNKANPMENIETEIKKFLVEHGWDKLRPSEC